MTLKEEFLQLKSADEYRKSADRFSAIEGDKDVEEHLRLLFRKEGEGKDFLTGSNLEKGIIVDVLKKAEK